MCAATIDAADLTGLTRSSVHIHLLFKSLLELLFLAALTLAVIVINGLLGVALHCTLLNKTSCDRTSACCHSLHLLGSDVTGECGYVK